MTSRGLIPASEQEYPILGLNLLRLLVQNRIAEFHTGMKLSDFIIRRVWNALLGFEAL